MAKALQPQIAGLVAAMQPIVDNYVRTATVLQPVLNEYVRTYVQMNRVAEQIAATINTSAINAALREFNGSNWTRLAEQLSETATVAVEGDNLASAVTVKPTVGAPEATDWRAAWWLAIAVLAVALFITLSIATVSIFGPVVLDEVRDTAVVAIAMHTAIKAWGERKNR